MGGRRIVILILAALVLRPSVASAQKEQFFDILLSFYQALGGVYGNEGPELKARAAALSAALMRWDQAIVESEQQLRRELNAGDQDTALRVHTLLASMYMERSRFDDALREFDEDIRLDPKRAVFHRFKALVYQAAHRHNEAATAFRAAWLIDPSDVLNAYHLIVHRAVETTEGDIENALATMGTAERALIRGGFRGPDAPFISLHPVNDDAGGRMAFVPAAYSRAFSLFLTGDFNDGMTAVTAAVTADPLVADPAAQSEALAMGIAALREGAIDRAIEQLETAQRQTPQSSEAHRILGTAYGAAGDIGKSFQHLRDAVRVNPRDERSWLALARTLDGQNDVEGAAEAVRMAVGELPHAASLRWLQSVLAAKRQRTESSELDVIADVQDLVLILGRGELLGRVARLAQAHLEYERAIALLEERVLLTPNNPVAHRELGHAYESQGRDDEAYSEFMMTLFLDNTDSEGAAAIGRLHLKAGRFAQAIEALTRATALAPANAPARRALGESLVQAGRMSEGLLHLEQAERLQAGAIDEQRRQRTAAMQMVQAEVYMSQRQYDAAIRAWKEIIELQGANPPNLFRLAEALIAAQQLEAAAAELQRAIELKAGPEAYRRLADVLAALGRAEESARARQTYMEQRLQELRQRSTDAAGTP
jgi:tetratricopeptide (TPR) repeat protein